MNQPEQIGPFRVLSTVGRGGMGAVYKAVHEETNEVVALKVLLDSVAEDNELRNRFEAEIETLKRLRHPNIVRLYGFGQEEGLLYYAMEYIDGPSLAALLKEGNFFSWEQVVHIGVEVCKALRHAHDRGVIHRDIKPANIMLLENGDVKVSDYGIAHFFGNSRLTTANMVIGTIEFMSPEQAQAGPLTPKSDIYSLGALLYALMTGTPPHIARTLPEILQKYRTGPPESIRYRRPEVPNVLDMFIMELLRVQPDKRPLDARIVGRRLAAIRLAFSQSPEENPFKNGLQRTHSTDLERRVAAFEEQIEIDTFGDLVLGSSHKRQEDHHEPSRPKDESDHFFESVTAPSVEPGGFSFGNAQEFSTGKMTVLEESTENESNPKYDFPLKTDQTAGLIVDSPHGSGEQAETGFDLSRAVSDDLDRSDMAQVPLSDSLESSPGERPDPLSKSSSDANPFVTKEIDAIAPGEGMTDDFEINLSPVDSSSNFLATQELPVVSQADSYNVTAEQPGPEQPFGEANTPSALELPTRWTGALKQPDSMASDSSIEIGDTSNRDRMSLDTDFEIDIKPSILGDRSSLSLPLRPKTKHSGTNKRTSPHSVSSGKESGTVNGTGSETSSVTTARTSHFTMVEEHELGKLNTEPETNSYYVSIKIWVFSIFLICVGLLFWYSLRRPSADVLYERISTRIDHCEEDEYLGTLRSVEKHCRDFVTLYPNDRRVEKIISYLTELDLGNLERRLERQIERKSKNNSLTSVERAYIEAIHAAKNDPERGIIKLRAFIDIFSSDDRPEQLEKSDSKVSDSEENNRQNKEKKDLYDRTVSGQCVILAKRRLAQVAKDFEKSKASELSLLEGRLEYAESLDSTDPKRAQAIRQGIIAFYGEQLWAKPMIEKAKAGLKK